MLIWIFYILFKKFPFKHTRLLFKCPKIIRIKIEKDSVNVKRNFTSGK